MEEGCAAINRKHPDRGGSHKPHVPAPEGIQGGKDDFHAPSDGAAFDEVLKKMLYRRRKSIGMFGPTGHDEGSFPKGGICNRLVIVSILFR